VVSSGDDLGVSEGNGMADYDRLGKGSPRALSSTSFASSEGREGWMEIGGAAVSFERAPTC
jgi:hypothetical protein